LSFGYDGRVDGVDEYDDDAFVVVVAIEVFEFDKAMLEERPSHDAFNEIADACC
jgi:hypothetical protein